MDELPQRGPRWHGFVVRLLGLGIVVAVLASQVHWWDRITVGGVTRYEGVVERMEGEAVTFRTRTGQTGVHEITPGNSTGPAETRVSQTRVHLGLRSLGRRLLGSWPTVLLVLLGLMGLIALTSWRLQALMHAAGVGLHALHTLRLTWIGSFFNLAFPGSTGGDVVKAVLASRATGAPTRSVLSVFGDRALGILGLIVLAGAVLVLYPLDDRLRSLRVVVLLLLFAGLVLAGVVFSSRIRRALGLTQVIKRLPFQQVIREAGECSRMYGGRPRTLTLGLLISTLNHAGLATAVWVLADALGMAPVTLSRAVLLVPLANLVSAIPLLPGGWGVGEAAFAYFFGLVGVPATEAVSLSVVYRLAVLASSLPGGLLWMGSRRRSPARAQSPRALGSSNEP